MVQTIYWDGDCVRMLDQTRLPGEVRYVPCTHYDTVATGIRDLWIRGAPAIGIAAAMGMALAAMNSSAKDDAGLRRDLETAGDVLLATRPTAVNLAWAVERMLGHFSAVSGTLRRDEIPGELKAESQRILEEDVRINERIGEIGARFVRDGDTILTHCNAGSLATGGYGTATAVIRYAHKQGKHIRVFADETRPVLQGARLTAWELGQDGIDVTLIVDGAAGHLMQRGEIDLAVVGTDRTARNGDVANKIGTYTVAVLCRRHNIPFYVAAPRSSIDLRLPTGVQIPIEERGADEVRSIGGVSIAPEGVAVRNPAFDVTPAELVTAIITEDGAFRPKDLKKLDNSSLSLESFRLDTPRDPIL